MNDSQEEEDGILGYWEQHLAGWKSLTSVFEGSAGCRSLVHNVPHIRAYQNEVLGIIYDILMSFGVILKEMKTLKGNKIQIVPFSVLTLKIFSVIETSALLFSTLYGYVRTST